MKGDTNCARIFHDMTDEGWHDLIDKNRREISDYVYQAMFDDNENPEAGMMQFFREHDFGAAKVDKGNIFAGHEEYVTDTDSVLDEIRIWSELAADVYIAGLPEDDRRFLSREYAGKIITRYVLEKVAEVVEMANSRLKLIPQALFRSLPALLDARTKPAKGGLAGLICSIIADEEDGKPVPKREFKPYLQHNPWETIEKLKRKCIEAMEQGREFESTRNGVLRAYLSSRFVGMDYYGILKKKPEAMQLLEKLDEKISQMGIFHTHDREEDVFSEEASLVAYIIDAIDMLHPRIVEHQIAEMRKAVDEANPADVSPLQLLGRLKEYRQDAPKHFYLDRIMSGKSAVEKFGNPDVVKNWIRASFGEVVPEIWDRKKHAKEFAYIGVLGEMRGCRGFNDLCFEPLAEMLVAQENLADGGYVGLAFVFSGYVARNGGSPDCLQGMEKESIGVKTEFVDVLEYNAKRGIMDIGAYERKLRKRVMAAGTDDEKMKVLGEAGEELRQAKANYEKMMEG